MALPDHINDREMQKFIEIDGEVYVKVTGSNLTGEFTPGGLKRGGKITKVELTNSEWRPLPATPFVIDGFDRAHISIQNRSGQDIAIAFADENGDPPDDLTYLFDDGWLVQNAGEIGYDVSPGVLIYGRSKLGDCFVKTKELA